MKYSNLWVLALLSGAAFCGPGARADATQDIAGFHEVSPGLYRGAAPGSQGMTDLSQMGIKTDVDMEAFREWVIGPESKLAAALSIDFIHEPVSAWPWILNFLQPVDDVRMTRIVAELGNKDLRPLYVHCEHGQDRTGLAVALHRVFNEGWQPKDAWDEMLALGFHTSFLDFVDYFEKKTGYDPGK